MADKLKLSTHSSDQLNFLSNRLNLKRNLICRIALSVSLAKGVAMSTIIETDSDGYEFNKPTILGPDETYFKALACYIQNEPSNNDFFNIIVRNHIENGLDIMFSDYQRINSPIGFLSSYLE